MHKSIKNYLKIKKNYLKIKLYFKYFKFKIFNFLKLILFNYKIV